MKVVINKCYGGFGLSPEAALWLNEKGYNGEGFKTPVEEYYGGKYDDDSLLGYKKRLSEWREYLENPTKKNLFLTVFTPDEKFVLTGRHVERNHPLVIQCVETLGESASDRCSKLAIVEIPDGVQYVIEEYDGYEHIAETQQKHIGRGDNMKYFLVAFMLSFLFSACNDTEYDTEYDTNSDMVSMFTASKDSTSKEACFNVTFKERKYSYLTGDYCIRAVEKKKGE
jgi:hypothetical protein